MTEEIIRLYGGIGDDEMLTAADTMQVLLAEDVDDFTAMDESIAAEFVAAFETAINNAREFPSDETVVDEITGLTNTVNTTWGNCKVHFQEAKYYIEKGFKNDIAKQNVFGVDDYRVMSRDQDKVIKFMDQFHKTCSVAANKTILIDSAGYTQLKIDEILVLRDAFREAQKEQEAAIKNRPVQTQTRINLHNTAWGYMQTTNKASKNVYRTNFAKLQEYLLPAAGSNEEGLSLTGIVTLDGVPKAGVIVALTALGLTSPTDDNGKFGFAGGLPAGATPVQVISDDIVTINDTVTLIEDDTVTKNFAVTAA